VRKGDRLSFPIADEDVSLWLSRLVASGHGVASLSIERPGLHDAFVRIVGTAAGDDNPTGEAP